MPPTPIFDVKVPQFSSLMMTIIALIILRFPWRQWGTYIPEKEREKKNETSERKECMRKEARVWEFNKRERERENNPDFSVEQNTIPFITERFHLTVHQNRVHHLL